MNPEHRQGDYQLRCDWGSDGARAIAAGADIAVVVDVLSFTTCVSVATDAGIEVFPHRWRDESAARLAAEHGAALAVGRSAAGPGQISLSPTSIRAARSVSALVLPSPNGSTIVHEIASGTATDIASGFETTVIAASLRNAAAVARWIIEAQPRTVALIPAGERWPDGALRPAIEDLWGAGAVLSGLPATWDFSPEATVALAAWSAVQSELPQALRNCASGRELIAIGFGDDVAIAAESGAGEAVPVLRDGRFRNASTG